MSDRHGAEQDWMGALARHYADFRRHFPDDRLLLVLDIDGTILDMRHSVLHVLNWYDFVHATDFFAALRVGDVDSHEDDIDGLLERCGVPVARAAAIRSWYREHLWLDSTCRAAHVPYKGVLEIVRWFQLQPRTSVGLNTGRSEAMRDVTLASLNGLAAEYRAFFEPSLLHMSQGPEAADILAAKVAAIRGFERSGYRVFAMIDNEPAVLETIGGAFPDRVRAPAEAGGILLLHADTVFQSRRELIPPGAKAGSMYNPTSLIAADPVPRPVQFVWHGASDRDTLARFLGSSVHWAELEVGLHPLTQEAVLLPGGEELDAVNRSMARVRLGEVLALIRDAGRAVKLDLRENGALLDTVLEMVDNLGFAETDLWFSGEIECLQEAGIRRLSRSKPNAVIQVPVNFLGPLVAAAPGNAAEIVEMLKDWGINRMSIGWSTPNKRGLMDFLDALEVDVNIYKVPDLEAFLHAVLLSPKSITSSYEVPGSGWAFDSRKGVSRGAA